MKPNQALRGGNWNDGANAGVFDLNLNNARTNSNGNVGFRSALPLLSETAVLRECGQYVKGKGASFHTSFEVKNKRHSSQLVGNPDDACFEGEQ